MRVSAGLAVTTLSGKIRIHTLPPRFRWWVMVRRAASIWRAVIQAGSRVRMANSPKAMVLPRKATPPSPPWVRLCILRCFMRLGCNMRLTRPVSSKAASVVVVVVVVVVEWALAGPRLQRASQLLDLDAALADHDAGLGRVDGDRDHVGRALDLDFGDAG